MMENMVDVTIDQRDLASKLWWIMNLLMSFVAAYHLRGCILFSCRNQKSEESMNPARRSIRYGPRAERRVRYTRSEK